LRVSLVFVKSDGELIQRVLDGDSSSSSLLYKQYYSRVFRFVHNKVQDTATAQDIAQETMLAALKYLHTYKGKSSFYTWLCTIAINKVSKVRSVGEVIVHEGATNSTPEDMFSSKQTMTNIAESFKALSKMHQMALFYKVYEQLTYKEISSKIGCTPSYAKFLVYEAKQIVRPLLKEMYNETNRTKRK
jgi:RNA polymerase sigma-70 factor, ECF subfamily